MNRRSYEFETKVISRLAAMSRAEAAGLRRSLSHPPGEFTPAIRVLEYFFNGDDRRRKPTYIVGGLFADVWRPPNEGSTWTDADTRLSLPRAMRVYIGRRGSDARGPLERRFLTLIDTTLEGVTIHMRPLLRMMYAEGLSISWTRLLSDISQWNSPDNKVQLSWAREFYRAYDQADETNDQTNDTVKTTSIITT